jgi:hypothetical protein
MTLLKIRIVGDWQVDASGSSNYDPFDPNTFMEYDKWYC